MDDILVDRPGSRAGSFQFAVFTPMLLLALLTAHPASAQSGSVSGSIRSASGTGVAQALVTLTAAGAGVRYEVSSRADGSFVVPTVREGSYEIRVEAIGYRPLVARGLNVGADDAQSIELTIMASPPPIVSVDTIFLAASAASRVRQGSVRLTATDTNTLPNPYGDIAPLIALSTTFDRALGSQGLPGDQTIVLADGIPFRRAPHPSALMERLPNAIFPAAALTGVAAEHNGWDTDRSGSASGYVALSTGSSELAGGFEVEGGYSSDAGWSSSRLELDAPSFTSFRGAAHGALALGESSRLAIAGEATSHRTPLGPQVSESVASGLAGLDPTLLTQLVEPGLEAYERYSGLARLDVQRSQTSHLFVRAATAFSRREYEGIGPLTIAGLAAPLEETFELSTALGLTSQLSIDASLDLRAGFSGSFRDFPGSSDGIPPAYLTAPGAIVGPASSSFGESARTDIFVQPMVHYALEPGRLTFGATALASRHTIRHSSATLGDFFFSDASALMAGRGFGEVTTSPEKSFGTRELGVHARYEAPISPTFRLTFGARYDYEIIGPDAASLNPDWLAVTGLATDDYKDAFNQVSTGGSVSWDASPQTRMVLAASLHHGDVDTRLLYQLFAGDAESTRFSGTGIDWPAAAVASLPSTYTPTLTLLGPDARPPRTTNLDLTLVQSLTSGVSMFVRGSTRRTDFLMRRRNLNLPIVPQGADPGGRPIYGTLEQDGAVVTTTVGDARRFDGFGDVWALDPDGWSEYVAITSGIEFASPGVDLFASHTYSETTDNWIGAGRAEVGASVPPGLTTDPEAEADWAQGVSDFDAPHRIAAGAVLRTGRLTLSSVYRFESGSPFTPRYRLGVDANGDGSARNDVAFVPTEAELATLIGDWPCLRGQAESFATRNSCRAPNRHSMDLRIEVRLGEIGGRSAHLSLDAYNLVEPREGIVDEALLLVDEAGSITTSADGTTIQIPTVVNPNFGDLVYPTGRGRMLWIGLRIGG